MKKLIDGIIQFRQDSLEEYRAKFAKLALGQNPDTLFIACCDSRVVPNVFASCDPGDLFVVRNIGNIVPPYAQTQNADISTAAAIAFSVLTLNVQDIIICGHSQCAAMEAFTGLNINHEIPFLNNWLEFAHPSYEKFKQQAPINNSQHLSQQNQLSQLNVLQQLNHLKTYPYVQERLLQKQLRIHGWWFDLATADVYHYEKQAAAFTIINEDKKDLVLESL
ncbi:MAG: Carbonic anhydrase 1 [Legionellaceae bacterium]